MPSEHEIVRTGACRAVLRRTPGAQQHEEGADRGRDVQNAPPDAAEIARRDDDVHGDERSQHASQDHVRGLKAAMALP